MNETHSARPVRYSDSAEIPSHFPLPPRTRWSLRLLRASRLVLALLGFISASVHGEEVAEKKTVVRATVELKDGSRLVGTPLAKTLPLKLDFDTAEIPLAKIRRCEIRHKAGSASVKLQNGDEAEGILTTAGFPMETILGSLTPAFDQINQITFTVFQEGSLPSGDGPLIFGGMNWTPWRTMFEVQGDKLVSLPKVRPGFNYGHGGNGRSAALVTNIGSQDWKDYSVEFQLGMSGVNPAHNLHGLPADYRSGGISFHVADAKESWNEKGESSYTFGIGGDGSWSLACAYNRHSAVPSGWIQPISDGTRTLANGTGLKLDPENGNNIRLAVVGTRIQIWVDGESIVDLRDEKMSETIGDITLDHGGIAISWGWECMGWIRNFSAKKL